ncbi:Druantia anti-phage system protein DruA [Ferrimicrobium acidiphilum]|uniref:Druantia anti-phage system protein DruA n=1 Tax=Ferrimicrobium acidiphilum TaxID=121039 RepID=UPI0023F2DD13|nr:Druantia anti-phage system protein DruA [Ferrimicrobium acidiphilum]
MLNQWPTLPWVRVPHLASHLLGAVARALPGHWVERYGYAPVLLETFVDVGRYAGTCYKAANWVRVGQTKGRGKLDRDKAYALGVKDIYCYPLSRNFRTKLLGEGNPAS